MKVWLFSNFAKIFKISQIWIAWYSLPPCISKGGSFWDWGYRNYKGKSVIIAGFNKEDVLCFYHSAETGATFTYPQARESGMPVFIGRDPKMPIAQIWQILKKYRF